MPRFPRLPLIPTIVVGLAVAAMIGLGVWQLERRAGKEALLAQLAANFDKPQMAFPRVPVGDDYLFRKADALCLQVVGWASEGGRSAKGTLGYRQIAQCRTGVEGPVLQVDMGVSPDPKFRPQWTGGVVIGTITHAPDHRPLIAALFGSGPPKSLILVSDAPAPGLEATSKPGLGSVPNNHLAYAVQWFIFAAVAAAIYLLALHYRQKPKA